MTPRFSPGKSCTHFFQQFGWASVLGFQSGTEAVARNFALFNSVLADELVWPAAAQSCTPSSNRLGLLLNNRALHHRHLADYS